MSDRTPLEYARTASEDLAMMDPLSRTHSIITAIAAEGSLAALVSIAESLEKLAKRDEVPGTVDIEPLTPVRRRAMTDSRDAEVLPR